MGSHALYDFVDDNPTILHKALSYTNDLSVLAANRGMTSINAALQVDLTGQCASESVGPRQISGSGGQVDTAVGAQMAPGGKSVITLRSTYSAKDPDTGERRLQSRILPVLPEGAVVTLTRSNTHFVATEYGAVCLRGLTVPQRPRPLSPSPTRTFGIGWRRSFTASTACDGPSVCGNRERPRNQRVPGPAEAIDKPSG